MLWVANVDTSAPPQKEGAKVKSIILLLCHPLQKHCLPNFCF